jgi:long-chain fatty acid transport protein
MALRIRCACAAQGPARRRPASTKEILVLNIRFVRPRLTRLCAAVALTLGVGPTLGAGFQLNETSASGLGTAYAGGAAVAEDSSTLWSNVAGISRIRERQVVGAIHLIKPSIKFSNENSTAPTLPAVQPLGSEGGDAGGMNVVPNLYFAAPLGPQWSAGLGLNSPFGLVTEYSADWMGRFQAIKSGIKTINVNPAVAWKPTPRVGLGFGANYQRIEAEFTNTVPPAGIGGLSSTSSVEGSDSAWGWNLGVLWEVDDNVRVGAHYRSSIDYHITGTVRFSNPALAAANGDVTSDVKLPAILNLSYFAKLNDRWDLLFDAQWTQWSTIQSLTFTRTNGAVLQSTPENFTDTWKAALGAHYRYNSAWTLRGGIAYDQSPVSDAYRTPRLPDSDRTWLAAGGQYRIDSNLTLDFGAAYVMAKKATIDISGSPPNSAVYGRLNGHYDANTVIASGQVNYSF